MKNSEIFLRHPKYIIDVIKSYPESALPALGLGLVACGCALTVVKHNIRRIRKKKPRRTVGIPMQLQL